MDSHQDGSVREAADSTPAGSSPTDDDRPAVVSPGLASKTLGAAFELKFQLSLSEAARIEDWARTHLSPDKHGTDGCYRVTSLYCDTPVLDVFHRNKGYKRTKFRLRRYDGTPLLFVERKTKRNDRVQKRRSQISADELAYLRLHPEEMPPETWAGSWFLRRVRQRSLRPTCCVTYRRAAFFGMAGESPIRMTLDRDVSGLPTADWMVPEVDGGQPLLPDSVLLEMKFHLHLPPLFRELLSLLPGQAAKASKYRRCVTECGLWDGTPPAGTAGSVHPAGGLLPAGLVVSDDAVLSPDALAAADGTLVGGTSAGGIVARTGVRALDGLLSVDTLPSPAPGVAAVAATSALADGWPAAAAVDAPLPAARETA